MFKTMKKKIAATTAGVTALAVSVGAFFAGQVFGEDFAQQVSIGVSNAKKVDVVISTGIASKEKLDRLPGFDGDLRAKLAEVGLSPEQINMVDVQSVQASKVDMQTSFNWSRSVDYAVANQFSFSNGGRNFSMIGNTTLAGKNAAWVTVPEGRKTQKFSFSYNIDYGDNFNSAGMLFNVIPYGSGIKGYALKIGKNGNAGTGYQQVSISEFYFDGNNRTNMQWIGGTPVSIPKSGTINLTVKSDKIAYSVGGYTGTVAITPTGGRGFGFYSDHYSHGCDNRGSFTMSNLTLEETTERSLAEVMASPTFRTGTYRLLVNVSDETTASLGDASDKESLLNRMLNEGIDYMAWGSAANAPNNSDFLQKNHGNGIVYSGGDYNKNVTDTANYIKDNYFKLPTASNDVVVKDYPIVLNITPAEYTSNTMDAGWPQGRWKVVHDPGVYGNPEGLFPDSGNFIDAAPTTLTYPGKYDFYFQGAKVKTVFVHRKPVADFNATITDGKVNYTNLSYDPDAGGSENTGLLGDGLWQYRTDKNPKWVEGHPDTIEPNTTYQVMLQVLDNYMVMSEPVVKMLNTSISDPTAGFTLEKDTFYSLEKPVITDTSSSPNGDPTKITSFEIMSVDNAGNKTLVRKFTDLAQVDFAKEPTNPPTEGLASRLNPGKYLLVAKATNTQTGAVSKEFSRNITIITDTTAPTVTFPQPSAGWTGAQSLDGIVQDSESSFTYSYTVKRNGEVIQEEKNPTSPNFNVEMKSDGTYEVEVTATNDYGLTVNKKFGPFKVDVTAPTVSTPEVTYENNSTKMSVSAADPSSGVAVIEVIHPDGRVERVNNNSYTLNNAAAGEYSIVAKDNVGNASTAVKVNVGAPRVPGWSIDLPTTPDWTLGVKVNPVFTLAEESGSSVSKVKWDVSTSGNFDGTWDKELNGLTGRTYRGEITIPPTVISNAETFWLHVYGEDAAGNNASHTFGPYKIDRSNPVFTKQPELSYQDGRGVITTEASDTGSGLATYTLKKTAGGASVDVVSSNGTFEVWTPGTYVIVATDRLGNETRSSEIKVVSLSAVNPKVAANPTNTQKWVPSINVGLTATSPIGTAITSISYIDSTSPTFAGFDDPAWTKASSSGTASVTLNQPGVRFLQVMVEDANKNKVRYSFGPYRVDPNPPVISNVNIEYVNNQAKATIDGTDNESRVVSWGIQKEGADVTWGTSKEFDVTETGKYVFWAVDEAGNKTKTQPIEIGPMKAPTVKVLPDRSDWVYRFPVDIKVDSELPHGTAKYALSLNGDTIPSPSSPSWKPIKPEGEKISLVSPGAPGAYYLFVEAKDKNGNTVVQKFGQYYLDSDVPVVSKLKSEGKDDASTITAEGSDSGSGIVGWKLTTAPLLEKDRPAPGKTTPAGWQNKPVFTDQKNGIYYVYAVDAAGNVSAGNQIEVRYLKPREITETFTVTFDTNGGNTIFPLTVESGSTATPPAKPTKPDMEFKGWFKEKSLMNSFSFSSTPIIKNTVVYAKWGEQPARSDVAGPEYTRPSGTVYKDSVAQPTGPQNPGFVRYSGPCDCPTCFLIVDSNGYEKCLTGSSDKGFSEVPGSPSTSASGNTSAQPSAPLAKTGIVALAIILPLLLAGAGAVGIAVSYKRLKKN